MTARLNPTAVISAAVREAENAHLLSQSGATTVVLSSEAAGRLVGLSTRGPAAVDVLVSLRAAVPGPAGGSAQDADAAGPASLPTG